VRIDLIRLMFSFQPPLRLIYTRQFRHWLRCSPTKFWLVSPQGDQSLRRNEYLYKCKWSFKSIWSGRKYATPESALGYASCLNWIITIGFQPCVTPSSRGPSRFWKWCSSSRAHETRRGLTLRAILFAYIGGARWLAFEFPANLQCVSFWGASTWQGDI